MSVLRSSRTLWILAIIITLVSAVWQRLSGPTHPVRGTATVAGEDIRYRLTRSHSTSADQPVRIEVGQRDVAGEVRWRRYRSHDDWQTIAMVRQDGWLDARLPRQPPAGKLQYQVVLESRGQKTTFPTPPAITRFKDDVSLVVLVTHVAVMFAALLISARAGLGALAGGTACGAATAALWLWIAGGLVLGPVVQKQAFDAYWTGYPFGEDLTDNKTLLAVLAWALAAWRCRRPQGGRWPILTAALITFVVFAIPHSTWGSEIDWTAPPPGASTP